MNSNCFSNTLAIKWKYYIDHRKISCLRKQNITHAHTFSTECQQCNDIKLQNAWIAMKSLQLACKLNIDRRHIKLLTISPKWLWLCWTRLEFRPITTNMSATHYLVRSAIFLPVTPTSSLTHTENMIFYYLKKYSCQINALINALTN